LVSGRGAPVGALGLPGAQARRCDGGDRRCRTGARPHGSRGRHLPRSAGSFGGSCARRCAPVRCACGARARSGRGGACASDLRLCGGRASDGAGTPCTGVARGRGERPEALGATARGCRGIRRPRHRGTPAEGEGVGSGCAGHATPGSAMAPSFIQGSPAKRPRRSTGAGRAPGAGDPHGGTGQRSGFPKS
jgi:hypothetical protein